MLQCMSIHVSILSSIMPAQELASFEPRGLRFSFVILHKDLLTP